MTTEPLLAASGVTRIFPSRAGEVTACRDVDLEVFAGELLVIHGPSGSGKTTLLNLLGGLDRPTHGTVFFGGRDLAGLDDRELLALRRHQFGHVFQTFGLLPMLSAAENVEIPLRIVGMNPRLRTERVLAALDAVGLTDQAGQRQFELSGGQQQRVAIARALVGQPRILLADEPTGQLDSGTATSITELISSLVSEQGVTAVVTTHQSSLMLRASRLVHLRDGRIS